MNSLLFDTVKNHRIFSGLGDETIHSLLNTCKIVNLKEGEILFNQDDPSDALYLTIRGQLLTHLIGQNGTRKSMGLIKAGETFGELGVLADSPRSLTVQAIEDSELLYIPALVFKELFSTHASVCVATAYPMITRSIKTLKLAGRKAALKHLVVFPADSNLPLDKIYENFAATAKTPTKELLVLKESDWENKIGGMEELISSVEELSIATESGGGSSILYLLSSHNSPFAKTIFPRATIIYPLANNNVSAELYQQVMADVNEYKYTRTPRKELILFDDNNHVSKSFDLRSFPIYHKIKLQDKDTYKRILRFMLGKAVSMVLSGGGARGWIHLGTIKAIKEFGLPIDTIGGTSIGSVIGAMYAMGLSPDEIAEKATSFSNSLRRYVSLKNFTFPVVGMFSGKDITRALQDLCGNLSIEDLPMYFFCTSCNISTSCVSIHSSGNLFEKVRASVSVPALMPPMIMDGDPHVDGSVLNDLPVNTMKNALGDDSTSKVIASYVAHVPDKNKYNFPPVFTFTQSLLYQLKLCRKKYKVIDFFGDSFMRVAMFGGAYFSKSNALLADVLIECDLSDFPLFGIDEEGAKRLAQRGYETALKKLHENAKSLQEYIIT